MEKLLSIFVLFLLFHFHLSLCEKPEVMCRKEEREALLKFQSFFTDNLSDFVWNSWIGRNCCKWQRVDCDSTRGHVIKLDLQGMHLISSGLDSSLLALKHLNYLDLSRNDFQNSSIPSFIGSMKELQHLDLSSSSFSGRVPPNIGNLTKLHFLNISQNNALLHVDDHMEWIYSLSSLKHLDMNLVNLGAAKALNLIMLLTTLPSLKSLNFSNCQLHDTQFFYGVSHDPFQNATSLEFLDLSSNAFNSSVPFWIGGINSLIYLDLHKNQFRGIDGGLLSFIRNTCHLQILSLSYNNLHGNLSEKGEGNSSGCLEHKLETLDLASNKLDGNLQGDWLGQLKNLRSLDLSGNLFSGPIPSSFFVSMWSVIRYLNLTDNKLNGSIPTSLGRLQSLEELYIQQNSFGGVVSEVHFMNLSKLLSLKMGNQRHLMSLKIKSDWVPPFHDLNLISLQYFSTNGSEIPLWLQTLKQLHYLDLSYCDITGIIPTWLRVFSDLSHLDLSNNQIKGSIPTSFGDMFPRMQELNLKGNQINGSLPTSLCKIFDLILLDISENRLSGSLPDCWSDIIALILSSNQLSGVIPNSLDNAYRLQDLRLGNNHFDGEIPSFANCTFLKILDLGTNQLSGNITAWLQNGSKLENLVVLKLRENKLNGSIPLDLCRLRNLRILDFASNDIIGTIPHCLGNLPAMMGEIADFEIRLSYYSESDGYVFDEGVVVQVIKGREFSYSKIGLKLFVNMDLSNNKMAGFIPIELTQLTGLIGLNLSRNNFSGRIPTEIGRMRWLESLDMSSNKLSGPLPISMLKLTSLAVLNVSYNNLSGPILQGNQFSTLNDLFSYIGNPYLCGDPLSRKCEGDKPVQPPAESSGGLEDDDDKRENMWLYIIIMLGYGAGFWGVVGVLIVKKSWRDAYFQFAEDVKDRIYVKIVLNAAGLKRLIN